MSAPLDLRSRQRLARLLGMIGSQHDAESLVAARKADEMVRRCGLTWEQALSLPTDAEPEHIHDRRQFDLLADWPERWPEAVAFCQEHPQPLNEASRQFVTKLADQWIGEPTEKQLEWLRKCVVRIQAGVGA